MEKIVAEIGLNDAELGLLGTCKRSPNADETKTKISVLI